MYVILEYFLFIGVKRVNKAFIAITVFAIVFSGLTELIQHYYVTNRYGEWMDFVANLAGILSCYAWLQRKKS